MTLGPRNPAALGRRVGPMPSKTRAGDASYVRSMAKVEWTADRSVMTCSFFSVGGVAPSVSHLLVEKLARRSRRLSQVVRRSAIHCSATVSAAVSDVAGAHPSDLLRADEPAGFERLKHAAAPREATSAAALRALETRGRPAAQPLHDDLRLGSPRAWKIESGDGIGGRDLVKHRLNYSEHAPTAPRPPTRPATFGRPGATR